MKIHSEFLVHWTGSDIESQRNTDKPGLYLNRLLDVYAHGLFAKRTNEAVVRRMKMKNIVRWCFTEIRLSQAHQHAERFGRLGIGFTREFIIEKGGRPVIYIPFDAPDSSRLLEDSIRYVHDNSVRDSEVQRSAKYIMAHVKRMGDSPASYEHYEEMEWRIVRGESQQNRHFTNPRRGEHRLEFLPTDVQIIIFPDSDTRELALENDELQPHLDRHMPVMATLADCGHF